MRHGCAAWRNYLSGEGPRPRSKGVTDLEQCVSCWERTLVLLGTSVVDRGAMRTISVTRVQGRPSQTSRTKRSGHRVGTPTKFCFQLRRDGLFNVYKESHG